MHPIPLLLATTALLWSLAAQAHDAWVAPGPGPVWPVLYGHEVPSAYAPDKVKAVRAFDAAGDAVALERVRGADGIGVRTTAVPALFTVDFDNGFFSRVDGKSVNLGKREAPRGTQSSHPVKWSKTVLAWGPRAFEAVGQRLEIVPRPFDGEPTAGRSMTLQVLLDGKPLAGARVERVGGGQPLQADAQGLLRYPVVAGDQRLSVEHRIATPDDPDADTLAMNASLVFVAR